MIFQPRSQQQQQILSTEAELTVVLGGAGTGKTTCALAAANVHLERKKGSLPKHVLFLSFSRASVSRIVAHSRGVLGRQAQNVDISTFHALAYSIIRRFGSLAGRPGVTLVSPPRERLDSSADTIGYQHLLPLALDIIESSPAVRNHLQSRWGLIIVDEFQDTGDLQQHLLNAIAPKSRVMLLGDPNQCIYTFLESDGVRLERILEACDAAGSENTINLPEVSHRDPTGVIPGIARAVLKRDFDSPAVAEGISEGRLQIRTSIPLKDEVAAVAACVKELQNEGLGVAVFTHHNDMLAALSDGLEADGIDHEIAGLSDALACALDAQVEMIRFSANESDWDAVLLSLAVFITSAQRGRQVPALAQQIVNSTGTQVLQARLVELRCRLSANNDLSIHAAIGEAATAHQMIGLPNKSSAWTNAASLLKTMQTRVLRQAGRNQRKKLLIRQLAATAREAASSVLTEVADDPREIQLMNLYQTKGREADATIVVLREGDFMGFEGEPFPTTSRLLYVVFSRARHKIVVLLVGDSLHPAVAPLASLA